MRYDKEIKALYTLIIVGAVTILGLLVYALVLIGQLTNN